MAGKKGQKRVKGQGSLYKVGKFYYLQMTINGKRKKWSLRVSNRKEAEIKAQEIIDQTAGIENKVGIIKALAKAKGLGDSNEVNQLVDRVNLIRDNVILLEDAMTEYEFLPEQSASEATLIEYRRSWRKFLQFLESENLNLIYMHEIDPIHARRCAKYLNSQGLSASTYNKSIRFYRRIFDMLAVDAGLTSNPFSQLHTRTRREAIGKREFRDNEMNSIEKVLQSSVYIEDITTVYAIALHAGLRLKDCALIEWSSVDLSRRIISLRPYKTRRFNKYVQFPILTPLFNRLLHLAKTGDCQGYILKEFSQIYLHDRSNASRIVNSVICDAGLNDPCLTFHSCRYTFISNCAKAGVPMAVVQSIVGHGSPAMTRHYTHIDIETKHRALQVMENDEIYNFSPETIRDLKKIIMSLKPENAVESQKILMNHLKYIL